MTLVHAEAEKNIKIVTEKIKTPFLVFFFFAFYFCATIRIVKNNHRSVGHDKNNRFPNSIQ